MTPQEELLKKAAITFSNEAISNDIKKLLTDKVSYTIRYLNELNKLVRSLSNSNDRKIRRLLISQSYVKDILENAFNDCENTLECFNVLLTKLFKEKENIELDK